MYKSLVFLILFFSQLNLSAQSEYHFLVNFKFKNSSFNLSSPETFLSQKTIDRRKQLGLEIDSSDIPVNSFYLNELSTKSLKIEAKSKWNNLIVISSSLESINDTILKFSFVDTVMLIGEKTSLKTNSNKLDYGLSELQNELVNINYAHNKGFNGNGIEIAIIDAGFKNLNSIQTFDSLFINNQVVSSYDFVRDESVNYNIHEHGTSVLSVLGANSPGEFIGCAPKSKYHLLVSEDINQENLIEEFHLIEALEYCDSAGVDVVNISLGYSTFDDIRFSHNKNEFTGDSTILNKTCNTAWNKGLFIVSSAGNSGSSSWQVLTTPANANNVFTVGAVNSFGDYASLSSKGNPSVNANQKPNVAAVGLGIKVVSSNGNVVSSNGTSFSSPQIAGFVACLKQAFPSSSNTEIKEAVEKSSNQYFTPDSLIGYGIPDFEKAYWILEKKGQNNPLRVFPNPSNGHIVVSLKEPAQKTELFNLKGEIVFENNLKGEVLTFDLPELAQGMYIIKITTNKRVLSDKILIN